MIHLKRLILGRFKQTKEYPLSNVALLRDGVSSILALKHRALMGLFVFGLLPSASVFALPPLMDTIRLQGDQIESSFLMEKYEKIETLYRSGHLKLPYRLIKSARHDLHRGHWITLQVVWTGIPSNWASEIRTRESKILLARAAQDYRDERDSREGRVYFRKRMIDYLESSSKERVIFAQTHLHRMKILESKRTQMVLKRLMDEAYLTALARLNQKSDPEIRQGAQQWIQDLNLESMDSELLFRLLAKLAELPEENMHDQILRELIRRFGHLTLSETESET